MAYKALYRVYRPQNFRNITGQDHVRIVLTNAIKKNEVSHAYLFAGPHGTGKTSVARVFAKALNCKNRQDGFEPCNKCDSCTAVLNDVALDIIEMDAASHNGIQEIRTIKEHVRLLPAQGKHKVYIIDEVHMLTRAAFNALLKTLEEPPAHAVFVMATTAPHKVPATILSRVQQFVFCRINPKLIEDALCQVCALEKISLDPAAQKTLVRLAKGSLRDALSCLDQSAAYSNKKVTPAVLTNLFGVVGVLPKIALLNQVSACNLKEALVTVQQLSDKGASLPKLVSDLVDVIKDFLVFKKTEDNNLVEYVLPTDLSQIKMSVAQAYFTLDELVTLSEKLVYSADHLQALQLLIVKLCRQKSNLKINQVLKTKTAPETTKQESLVNKVEQKSDLELNLTSDKVILKKENSQGNKAFFKKQATAYETKTFAVNQNQVTHEEEINKKQGTTNESLETWQTLSAAEVVNLLVQSNREERSETKEQLLNLPTFFEDDKVQEFAQTMFNKSLHLLAAGKNFALFLAREKSVGNMLATYSSNPAFVSWTTELFNKQRHLFVVSPGVWSAARETYLQMKKNNSLPAPQPVEDAVPKTLNKTRKVTKDTVEIAYGHKVFGDLFKGKI